MKREKQRNNAAIKYANAVTDGSQDAWFDVVLKTHQDATAWADKTIIEKACEWLRTCNYTFPYKMIEDFKKAMEE